MAEDREVPMTEAPSASLALPLNQRPLARPGWCLSGVRSRLVGALAAAFLFSSVVVINGLQTLSLVLLPFSRKAFRAFNRGCAQLWWGWCVKGSEKVNRVRLVRTGDEPPAEENAIVVANHQQMPDIVVLMMLANPKGRLGDMKWFVKDVIKYVPGVGWGMRFLDCVFLKRNWDSDEAHIRQTFSKFRRFDIPIWLVSFVEGTRPTPEKLERSRAYAAKAGLEPPRHVLVPRTKGFTASVEGLRDHVRAVYDVTIAYEDGVPTLWQFICGQARRVHVNVRRVPVERLPADQAGLSEWLLDAFRRKDRLLAHFAGASAFPED